MYVRNAFAAVCIVADVRFGAHLREQTVALIVFGFGLFRFHMKFAIPTRGRRRLAGSGHVVVVRATRRDAN
eukprot:6822233-Lingulodinium_polyedra.AAC.1